jgi:hypothetical protein
LSLAGLESLLNKADVFIARFVVTVSQSVSLVTGYGLDDQMFGVLFLAGAGNFSL